MSEVETASQNTSEEAPMPVNGTNHSTSLPAGVTHQAENYHNRPAPQEVSHILPQGIAHLPPLTQRQNTSTPNGSTHHDLTLIIARAREDIRHLREELTRHEAQVARITQERDEIQQQYAHLYTNFLEAVHLAAEEEVRQTGQSLRANPERIPKLLEPVYESLTLWLDTQQTEREMVLRQRIATMEQQGQAIRQELIHERVVLDTERKQLAQRRQALHSQVKTRETWLKHRWFARAWGASVLMFLILPALQVYLLLEKASNWDIILIPTTICLVFTGLISLVRARKKPHSSLNTTS